MLKAAAVSPAFRKKTCYRCALTAIKTLGGTALEQQASIVANAFATQHLSRCALPAIKPLGGTALQQQASVDTNAGLHCQAASVRLCMRHRVLVMDLKMLSVPLVKAIKCATVFLRSTQACNHLLLFAHGMLILLFPFGGCIDLLFVNSTAIKGLSQVSQAGVLCSQEQCLGKLPVLEATTALASAMPDALCCPKCSAECSAKQMRTLLLRAMRVLPAQVHCPTERSYGAWEECGHRPLNYISILKAFVVLRRSVMKGQGTATCWSAVAFL